MPISNKILNVAFFLLTGIPPAINTDLIAKKDSNKRTNNSRLSINPQDQYESPEDQQYWESQKKYLVKPEDYYGSMPQDLENVLFMIQHEKEFKEAGLYKTSNFIFYGPPGVGKTYVGSIFAQKIGAEFMYVQGSELQDCYVGGHRKPEELFARARRRRNKVNKSVVMFIDEIDATVGSRDRLGSGPNEQQMIAALLKEIGSEVNDGIIVVAATNKIKNIDEALLRSGRMEHHIQFTLPNEQDRESFLKFLIKPFINFFDSKIVWSFIAQQLKGYTFADIKKIVDDLKQAYIIKKINTKDEGLRITHNDIMHCLDTRKK
ncbi:ATP-binding protein [Candidatus Dependentiae bacterium]|nr:ATP-binding protein [Candidatus Dependentiae bacterium]